MMDDFKYFYSSIRNNYKGIIIVAPIDFTNEQLTELSDYDVKISIVSSESVLSFTKIETTGRWVQWAKPSIIKEISDRHSVRRILWLDVDIVILKRLDEIFEYIDSKVLMTKDNFAPKTCLNLQGLYENQNDEVPINSGVVGLILERDVDLLDNWILKTKKATDDDIKCKISLYDQGCLIWAVNELRLNHFVIDRIEWNHPAKKNIYEDSIPTKWIHDIDSINSGILGEIELDNRNATIVHFAGKPQLSHLTKLDNNTAVGYINNKFGHRTQSKLFCVGLERCGTHTIAEIVRRSARNPCWVRHELYPSLSKEAFLKHNSNNYKTKDFVHKIRLYNRTDTKLICESNHRLGFFIEDIHKNVPNAKFVFMLRNPIDLIRSRLLNFSTWPGYADILPEFYLKDISNLSKHFTNGSPYQNRYRISPKTKYDDIVKLHIFEITETIEIIMSQLKQINNNNYEIIWLENIDRDIMKLNKLIPGEIYWKDVDNIKKDRFGSCMNLHSNDTKEWVDNIIDANSSLILDEFYDTIFKHDIEINSAGIMM